MDYYVLSLPEASGLYLGLQLQQMLRASSVGLWMPYLLILVGGMRLYWHGFVMPHGDVEADRRQWWMPWLKLGTYLAVTLALTQFLWPECSPFTAFRGYVLSSRQVMSYAADQSPEATIRTAWDTGEIVQDGTLVSTGFDLFLKWATTVSLGFARAWNPEAGRVFRPIVSMQMLFGIDLPAEVDLAVRDWVEGCWKPAMMTDQEFPQSITAQQLSPWGNGPVAQALASREVVPGAQTGSAFLRTSNMAFLSNPGGSRTVRCDVYLSAVESETQRLLFTNTTPAGVPLSQAFFEDLGKDVEWQARFLVYRAALAALGRPSPAPSLSGAYAALSAANAATGVASNAVGSLLQGGRVTILGALLGGGSAVKNQFEAAMQKMLIAVGIAGWFIYFSPVIFGQALTFLIGLFPIAFCYLLIPGRWLRLLLLYFLALFYVLGAPLWLAMVDLGARNQAALAPQSSDPLLSLFNWAPAMTTYAVATVSGLFVIFFIAAGVLFFEVRGMIGRLHG